MSWFTRKKGDKENNPKKKRRRDKDSTNLSQIKRGDSTNFDDSDHDDSFEDGGHHANNSSSSSYSNGDNAHHQQQSAPYQPQHTKKTKSKRNNKNSTNNASTISLYVGDKILLANKRSGSVTSLGPKPDKNGIWVRVVMDTPSYGGANSAYENGGTSKNKTIWVPIERVDSVIQSKKERKFNITINDRVIEKKKHIHGTVKYVGPTHFDKGIWFGVEYDQSKGKNNGTVKRKFYFKSRDNHGVMLPYKRLEHEGNTNKKHESIMPAIKKKKTRNGRSKSNNFHAIKNENGYSDHNGGTHGNGQRRSSHHKTTSDGIVVNHGRLAENIQLDQLDQLGNNHSHKSKHILSNGNGSKHNNSSTQNGGSDNYKPVQIDNENSNNPYLDNQVFDDKPPPSNNNNSNNNKSPSSDSEEAMFVSLSSSTQQQLNDSNNTNNGSLQVQSVNRSKKKPKEKSPFHGWKKLFSDGDDDKELTPIPSPYGIGIVNGVNITAPIELDDNNKMILDKFLQQIKKFTGIEHELYTSTLANLTEVDKEKRPEIFLEKLRLSQAKCDFFDTSDQMVELIEKKERMLLELSEFIARHVWFQEQLYEQCLTTVSSNLFRALPYQDRPPALSFFNDEVFDKDTNFEDPGWRHLKLVYDLTWRVINTPQVTANMMEKYMTGKFLGSLVELFASEDHRERAYLMMILHKIYGRCLKLRPYIINIMSGYFYRMIYADEFQHVNGIIELLQIICAIIPGLTVPVKESWQSFVRNILVPLHKCRGLKKFWEQLTQCCVNYVAKDEDGGAVILGGLLRYWPQQSPQKEEIFIMEVVNIINVLITHQHGFSYETYKLVLVAAANKLTQCMLSTRQPVAERAIAAWKEQSMQRLVDYDRKAFLPKLCEAFYRNREHQNAALKQSSTTVEKIYRSKDSAYWKKMQQYLQKKDKKENAIKKAISDAVIKNKDPYDIVKAKHAKDNQKKKRPKPLTKAEKKAKREHYWKKVELLAAKNNINL